MEIRIARMKGCGCTTCSGRNACLHFREHDWIPECVDWGLQPGYNHWDVCNRCRRHPVQTGKTEMPEALRKLLSLLKSHSTSWGCSSTDNERYLRYALWKAYDAGTSPQQEVLPAFFNCPDK